MHVQAGFAAGGHQGACDRPNQAVWILILGMMGLGVAVAGLGRRGAASIHAHHPEGESLGLDSLPADGQLVLHPQDWPEGIRLNLYQNVPHRRVRNPLFDTDTLHNWLCEILREFLCFLEVLTAAYEAE